MKFGRREGRSVEPTPEAEAEWVKIVNSPSFMTDYQSTCTPGYYNGEGQNPQQGFLEASILKARCAFTKCSPAGANRGISKVSSSSRS